MERQVLQVNKLYHPAVGGVETVVRDIAEGLTARGDEVRVLAARERGLGTRETIDGVRITRSTTLGVAQSVPLAPAFPVTFARAVSDVDIIHHHVPNPLGTVSHRLVRPEVPTVATYHSDIVRQASLMPVYERVLYGFLEQVDRILVTSPRLRDSSPHLSEFTDKCEVVPLSIDLSEYKSGTHEPPGFPVGAAEPFVLCVGRLNYYKGVEYLVRAMADVDGRLVVAGDGDRRESLETLAAELGVDDRVHFLGYVDERTLHYCYEQADVFVLPSVEPSEAFGIVQLEAMAYETPVVNTDLRTGVPWVSLDGETGLTVQPRDPESLAAAIGRLLGEDEERRAIGRAARERVEREFEESVMLDTVERVYDELQG
jgi:rhamnosyl/mannosyltransferase